jgi:transposase InsO family protein
MVVIDNKLYLSSKDLYKYGFTDTFIWTKTKEFRQGTITSYANIKGIDKQHDPKKIVTLIAFNSIPETTRTAKGLPTEEQLLGEIQSSQLSSLVVFSHDAYNYYLQQPATTTCAKQKAEEASWYIMLASLKPTTANSLGLKGKPGAYERAISLMQQQADQRHWPSFKLNSVMELRKRLIPFQQALKGKTQLNEAFASLISGKTGNTNAQKLSIDQQALLVQLYSDANAKPNFEQVWMIYTRKASEMISLGHWTPDALIAPSTVRAFLNKSNIRQLWYEARHGYQEYRNVFEPVTLRERPSYANALWVIDGTPSHRYFKHGDKGRYFRFNIFPVLDAHSWAVLGFWLSETENTEAVLGALRSACMVTGTLPHQVLYDNSSAIQSYRAQDAIDKISVVSFAASAGNARSKIIENFFHLFNQDVQKFRPGYTANPFALNINNRPNREALARMVKSEELVSAERALQQAIEDLTLWNNKPRKFLAGLSPIAAYRRSVELTRAKQRSFTETIDIEAFYTLPGEHKKIRTIEEGRPKLVQTFIPQTYEFTNRGIDIVIAGKKLSYDIEDAAFRAQFIGSRFTVKYEPNPERWTGGAPDRLLLYLQGAPLLWQGVHAAALHKSAFHMAVADYAPGEGAQLRAHLDRKKQQRALVQQDFTRLIEHTKQNGTYTPVITENAFDKQVIQDTNAALLDQLLGGEDFRLTEAPAEREPTSDIDRLRLGMDDDPFDNTLTK